MKLRIRGDSVRLRLSQSETVQLAERGAVADTVLFAPGNALEYRIEVRDVDAPVAGFDEGRIVIKVAPEAVRRWLEPTEVSIVAEQALEPGRSLRLLIEKDFACLTPREGEEDSDAFPNPKAASD